MFAGPVEEWPGPAKIVFPPRMAASTIPAPAKLTYGVRLAIPAIHAIIPLS